MKLRVFRSAGLSIGAAVTLVAFSLPGLVATSGASGSDGKTASPPADSFEIATTLTQLGHRSFSDIYAGLEGIDDGVQIKVYLTSLDPSAEKQFESLAGDVPLQFALAPVNYTTLQALHDRMKKASADLEAQGVKIEVFGPDFTIGRERVAVLDLTEAKSAAVENALGNSSLLLISSTAERPPALAFRYNDTNPFKGGAAIYHIDLVTGLGTSCTAGFGITHNNLPMLLTAAHCFANGTQVLNGICDGNAGCPSGPSSSIYMGSELLHDQADYGLDSAVINGPGSNLVFTTPVDGSATTPVYADHPSVAGYTVCNYGAFSGTDCNLTVQAGHLDDCLVIDDPVVVTRHACGMVEVLSAGGAIAGETGDSGGPVTKLAGGHLYAMGTVSAPAGAPRGCQHYIDAQCFTGMYYTDIEDALFEWDATVLTGP